MICYIAGSPARPPFCVMKHFILNDQTIIYDDHSANYAYDVSLLYNYVLH